MLSKERPLTRKGGRGGEGGDKGFHAKLGSCDLSDDGSLLPSLVVNLRLF